MINIIIYSKRQGQVAIYGVYYAAMCSMHAILTYLKTNFQCIVNTLDYSRLRLPLSNNTVLVLRLIISV